MEFVFKPEEDTKTELPHNGKASSTLTKPKRRTRNKGTRTSAGMQADNYMVRVNWLYRPKDVSKPANDTRVLYVSMTSALCPIASIRGKCTVRHKEHIKDMDEFRHQPNHFWFDKMFDLYILRLFDIIPTEKMINFPPIVCDALCARFQFAIMEPGRAKEHCVAPCNCAKCSRWCSSEDSILCATCSSSYHMSCLNPPLMRKPRHGFAWSCAECNKAYEARLQGNSSDANLTSLTLQIGHGVPKDNQASNHQGAIPPPITRYEELNDYFSDRRHGKRLSSLTDTQKHNLKLWPFRYLGAHARIEDILDLDDRIYPRAVSRISNKHQAIVPDWPGRPVIYYESERPEKRSKKTKAIISSGKPARIFTTLPQNSDRIKITDLLNLPKKERPAWLQEKPSGYVERGGDETVTMMWKSPSSTDNDQDHGNAELFLKNFAAPYAKKIGVRPYTPNFVDACLKIFMDCEYDPEAALPRLKSITKRTLREPVLSTQEVVLFEEGVRKYGSELREVCKVVKTKKISDIVRYYYMWKKTPNGHKIWDNFEGRKRNSKARKIRSEGELIDVVADIADDSRYDSEKATLLKRNFICKHCQTTDSEFWHRASGHTVAGDDNPIIALCARCAILWRRYAVIWENPEEVLKKFSKCGSSSKRAFEDELLKDGEAIFAERNRPSDPPPSKRHKTVQKASEPVTPKQKIAIRSRAAKRSSPSNLSDSSFSSLSSLSSLSSVVDESVAEFLNGNLFKVTPLKNSDILSPSNNSTKKPPSNGSRPSPHSRKPKLKDAPPVSPTVSISPDSSILEDYIDISNSPENSETSETSDTSTPLKVTTNPPIILRIPTLKLVSKTRGVKKSSKETKKKKRLKQDTIRPDQSLITSYLAESPTSLSPRPLTLVQKILKAEKK